jgi:hypothetical protein
MEENMKRQYTKWMLGVIVAGGFLCSSYSQVNAVGLQDIINGVKSKGPAYMCGKGDIKSNITSLFSGKVSIPTIRAGNGVACTIPQVAAFALKYCPKYAADFNASKCAGIARETLKTKKPDDVLKESPAIEQAAGAAGSGEQKP